MAASVRAPNTNSGNPAELTAACPRARRDRGALGPSAGELCVGDTANLLDLPIKLVSHHVRSLAERGLATKQRDGKLIRYRLTEDARVLLEAAFGREFALRLDAANQRLGERVGREAGL